MSYEAMRGHDYDGPTPFLPQSAWSGLNNRQYTSLPSPYEYQNEQPTSKPYPTTNQYEYFEPGDPDSSTTHIIESDSRDEHRSKQLDGYVTGTPWQPGFWRRFPWLGTTGVSGTVIATLACVVVLVKSQGVPIESWSFQPTVYLSVCTAIANIALTLALYEGMVISFWVKAGRGGTLQELHQYWQSGSSLWGAFYGISRLRGKVVGVACIMTVISIIRGPLMQRASSVQNTVVHQNGTLTVFSAVQIPTGYAGAAYGRSNTPSLMNPNFTEVVQAYTNKDDIVGVWSSCDSICYANVKGFGFGVACNTTRFPYSIEPIPNNGSYTFPVVEAFSIDASQTRTWNTKWNLSGSDAFTKDWGLLLNATFIAEDGNIRENLCTLRAGVVSYPVMISNNSITLQSTDWNNDTYLEDVGMGMIYSNTLSNLAGYILAVKALYYGTADYYFGGGVGTALSLNGASANRYLTRPNFTENYYALDGGYNISWQDPTEDMINSMREIAFRTSLRVAYDNISYENATQHIPFIGERPETVYTTNYKYMAGAVVISLLGVLAVLPTYRGFWELGRVVSFSPVELAKAFNAPLLVNAQGNQPAAEMLRELTRQKVRYGDSGQIVAQVRASSAYGQAEVVRRLEVGTLPETRLPEKGGRYV